MDQKIKISLKKIGIDKLVLIGIAGIILILTSVDSFTNEDENSEQVTTAENVQVNKTVSDEDELAEILSGIKGVGKVKVMITYKSTEEDVVKEDKTTDSSTTEEEDSEGGKRVVNESNASYTTIFTTDSEGKQVPYVIKTLLPEVEGVAVVAEGGGDVSVKEEIIGVVQALFNIELHKIWVTEMN